MDLRAHPPLAWLRSFGCLMAMALCMSATWAADGSCYAPADIGDGWEMASATASGFDDERLCGTLDAVPFGQDNIHGVVIERHGKLVAELYRDGPDKPMNMLFGLGNPLARDAHFDARTQHDARSISKSVVSLLLGIARDRGAVGGLSSSVLDFYPSAPELQSPQRNRITLENLLTMTSGLAWDEGSLPNDETRLYWTGKLLPFVFDRPQEANPGEEFHYNSGGVALVADILSNAQHAPLKLLAREQLFEPLGVTDWEWVSDLRGRELAFTGLRMRPRDMSKLGRLVLNRGRWKGRQIVSAAWIEASTAPHVRTTVRLPSSAQDALGYGYLWWTGTTYLRGRPIAWSAGFGNGGQRLFVVPQLDLSVVITAGGFDSRKINSVVNALFDRIVSAVDAADGDASLATRTSVLSPSTPASRSLR